MKFAAASLLDAVAGVAYVTNSSGMIVALGNGGWRAFAQDNGAAQLAAEPLVGRSLFDFIGGDAVKASYTRLHEKLVARPQRKVSFAFRCDAPETRRDMLMSMSAIAGDAGQPLILYQSQLLREESRPAIPLFRALGQTRRSAGSGVKPVVVLCSYCQRVAWPAGIDTSGAEWIAPEVHYARGGSAEADVSHGVCPPCFAALVDEAG